jgi:hypothetical protein
MTARLETRPRRFLRDLGLTDIDSPKYSPRRRRAHVYEIRDSDTGFIRGIDGCPVFRRPIRAPMSAARFAGSRQNRV